MNSLVKSKIYLAELGFFPQHSGFGYIAYAVTLLREDPMSFYCGSMNIVDAVAGDCGVSPDCVRRCMCYSLNSAWSMPANTQLRSIFPSAGEEYPPSLYEFITRAAIDLDARCESGAGQKLIRRGCEGNREAAHSVRQPRAGMPSAVR
jgi:hypothetical protein